MTTLRFDKMLLNTDEKEDLSVFIRNMGYGIMTNPDYRDEGVIYLKPDGAYDFAAAKSYLHSMSVPCWLSTQEIQVL